MQLQNHVKQSLRKAPVALTALAGFSMFALPTNPAQAALNNPLSSFPIDADGRYTNAGEWSDITPAWFTSNAATGATPVAPGTPGANSLLFAGLARDTPASSPELYLMYDYLGRTNPPTHSNEFLGSISFPLTVGGTSHSATVSFQTVPNFTPALLGGQGFFNVTVSLDGGAAQPAAAFGFEAGLFVGTTPVNAMWGVTAGSPFHTTPHALFELGVPLDISPAFAAAGGPASPFPAGGQSGPGGSGYSPDPAFWTSNLVDNAGDPPASGGTFTINPDGSTFIVPESVPAVPELTTLPYGLLAMAGALLSRRRIARKIC